MPLVQSRLSQNMQFTWVTHLFLKFALDVDIVVPASTDRRPLLLPTKSLVRRSKKMKEKRKLAIVSSPPLDGLRSADPTGRSL